MSKHAYVKAIFCEILLNQKTLFGDTSLLFFNSFIEWSIISSSIFIASNFFCFDELVCRQDYFEWMAFTSEDPEDLQHDRPRRASCDACRTFVRFLRSNSGHRLPMHCSHSQCRNVSRIWGNLKVSSSFNF